MVLSRKLRVNRFVTDWLRQVITADPEADKNKLATLLKLT